MSEEFVGYFRVSTDRQARNRVNAAAAAIIEDNLGEITEKSC
jgi:hypothetical protein